MFYIKFFTFMFVAFVCSASSAQGMPSMAARHNHHSSNTGAPYDAQYYAQRYAGGSPDQTSIGPGFLLSNSLYKGTDDNLFMPIPLVYYKADKFTVSGLTAKYEAFSDSSTTLSVLGQWRFDGYEAKDSTFLAGMAQRKRGFDGGLELKLSDQSSGYVTVAFLTDLSGNHKGNEARLSYGKTIRQNRTIITPSIGVKHLSNDFTRYYYGVRQSEAAALRPLYTPAAATNFFVGANVIHPVSDSWTLFVLVNYERLSSEISDSPIVDAKHRALLITGLMYNF